MAKSFYYGIIWSQWAVHKKAFQHEGTLSITGASALWLFVLITAPVKLGLSGSMWFFCHWLQQSHDLAAEGVRLMGLRGEQWEWEGVSQLGKLKQPEGGGQSISLPALNSLGWQKQRIVWVVQGVGLTSAKGSQDKKRSRELFLALTQHLSCRRKEQASFPPYN